MYLFKKIFPILLYNPITSHSAWMTYPKSKPKKFFWRARNFLSNLIPLGYYFYTFPSTTLFSCLTHTLTISSVLTTSASTCCIDNVRCNVQSNIHEKNTTIYSILSWSLQREYYTTNNPSNIKQYLFIIPPAFPLCILLFARKTKNLLYFFFKF